MLLACLAFMAFASVQLGAADAVTVTAHKVPVLEQLRAYVYEDNDEDFDDDGDLDSAEPDVNNDGIPDVLMDNLIQFGSGTHLSHQEVETSSCFHQLEEFETAFVASYKKETKTKLEQIIKTFNDGAKQEEQEHKKELETAVAAEKKTAADAAEKAAAASAAAATDAAAAAKKAQQGAVDAEKKTAAAAAEKAAAASAAAATDAAAAAKKAQQGAVDAEKKTAADAAEKASAASAAAATDAAAAAKKAQQGAVDAEKKTAADAAAKASAASATAANEAAKKAKRDQDASSAKAKNDYDLLIKALHEKDAREIAELNEKHATTLAAITPGLSRGKSSNAISSDPHDTITIDGLGTYPNDAALVEAINKMNEQTEHDQALMIALAGGVATLALIRYGQMEY